jgi:hypothetical protein
VNQYSSYTDKEIVKKYKIISEDINHNLKIFNSGIDADQKQNVMDVINNFRKSLSSVLDEMNKRDIHLS